MKRSAYALTGLLFGIAGVFSVANAATTIRILSIEPNDTKEKDIDAQTVKEFEAGHPGVTVEFQYLENEAYKAKLPTILQSDQRPALFQSWGGGVFNDQVKAGVVEPITGAARAELEATIPAASLANFTVDGKIYGTPRNSAMVVFWYNKDLAAKAGVDPTKIKTWDDFLGEVKAAKAAGVTPIILAAKDKWPVHFYYGYLALRIAGREGLATAKAGKDGGFNNPVFVKVGETFKQLIDLKPFQEGYADATFDKAAGQFGDGKGLFHLMGSFGYNVHQRSAADGKGLPDGKVGVIAFPAVTGGKGDPSDVFGGSDGWALAAGAPKETTDFLIALVSKTVQERSAKAGLWIPVVKGASDALANPFFRQIAGYIANAKGLQLYLDQAFGPAVGGAVNEAATDLALGATTPKDAAAHIEEAVEMQ